jgi:hypothetical protein
MATNSNLALFATFILLAITIALNAYEPIVNKS